MMRWAWPDESVPGQQSTLLGTPRRHLTYTTCQHAGHANNCMTPTRLCCITASRKIMESDQDTNSNPWQASCTADLQKSTTCTSIARHTLPGGCNQRSRLLPIANGHTSRQSQTTDVQAAQCTGAKELEAIVQQHAAQLNHSGWGRPLSRRVLLAPAQHIS